MKIGIISDTHNFLDPRIKHLFAGVEHILHGGDIGLPRLLGELEQIAPVTAVLGNTDDPAFGYELTEVLELSSRKFLIHHIVNPLALDESLSRRMQQEQPDVVVFGHTHKPFAQQMGRTLFFNPGYAGKPRFALPRSVALMHCTKTEIRYEYLPLD